MAPIQLTFASLPLILAAVVGGILPAIFWLWFWLREDKTRPEPTPLLFLVFLLGSLSVLPAYFTQQWLSATWPLPPETSLVFTLMVWAGLEELAKYLAVYLSAFQSRYFDEPVDYLIYLITAALGFATVENILFLLSALEFDGFGANFLLTGNFRFVGATLLHLVASAFLGIWLAFGFCRPRVYRPIYFFAGFLTASGLHAIFNYLIIKNDNSELLPIFFLLWAATLVIIFLFEPIKKIICLPQTKKP